MNSYQADSEFKNMGNAKIAKQPSVLEGELDCLKGEVIQINRLADTISDMLQSPSPMETSVCNKNCVNTVADSLREIRGIAEEARERFGGIAKLLEEQFGNLKLEY